VLYPAPSCLPTST